MQVNRLLHLSSHNPFLMPSSRPQPLERGIWDAQAVRKMVHHRSTAALQGLEEAESNFTPTSQDATDQRMLSHCLLHLSSHNPFLMPSSRPQPLERGIWDAQAVRKMVHHRSTAALQGLEEAESNFTPTSQDATDQRMLSHCLLHLSSHNPFLMPSSRPQPLERGIWDAQAVRKMVHHRSTAPLQGLEEAESNFTPTSQDATDQRMLSHCLLHLSSHNPFLMPSSRPQPLERGIWDAQAVRKMVHHRSTAPLQGLEEAESNFTPTSQDATDQRMLSHCLLHLSSHNPFLMPSSRPQPLERGIWDAQAVRKMVHHRSTAPLQGLEEAESNFTPTSQDATDQRMLSHCLLHLSSHNPFLMPSSRPQPLERGIWDAQAVRKMVHHRSTAALQGLEEAESNFTPTSQDATDQRMLSHCLLHLSSHNPFLMPSSRPQPLERGIWDAQAVRKMVHHRSTAPLQGLEEAESNFTPTSQDASDQRMLSHCLLHLSSHNPFLMPSSRPQPLERGIWDAQAVRKMVHHRSTAPLQGLEEAESNFTPTSQDATDQRMLSHCLLHLSSHNPFLMPSSRPQPLERGIWDAQAVRKMVHHRSTAPLQGLQEAETPTSQDATDRRMLSHCLLHLSSHNPFLMPSSRPQPLERGIWDAQAVRKMVHHRSTAPLQGLEEAESNFTPTSQDATDQRMLSHCLLHLSSHNPFLMPSSRPQPLERGIWDAQAVRKMVHHRSTAPLQGLEEAESNFTPTSQVATDQRMLSHCLLHLSSHNPFLMPSSRPQSLERGIWDAQAVRKMVHHRSTAPLQDLEEAESNFTPTSQDATDQRMLSHCLLHLSSHNPFLMPSSRPQPLERGIWDAQAVRKVVHHRSTAPLQGLEEAESNFTPTSRDAYFQQADRSTLAS